jgi:hypothetical protein
LRWYGEVIFVLEGKNTLIIDEQEWVTEFYRDPSSHAADSIAPLLLIDD